MSNPAGVKAVFVANADYLHACVGVLSNVFGAENVLCICYGDFSSAGEVATACAKANMQCFNANDHKLVEAVIVSYAPSVVVMGLSSLANGNAFTPSAAAPAPTVVTLEFGCIGGTEYYVSDAEREQAAAKKGHEKVAWPEFSVLYAGAKTSTISIKVDGVATPDVTEKVLDVTPFETAISLRYKHVRAMQDFNLLYSALQAALQKGAVAGIAADTYSSLIKYYAVSPQESGKHCVTEDGLNEAEAGRYIRGMTFPPYDCTTLVSKMDQQEYFIETIDQYTEYLDNIGEREAGAAGVNYGSRMPGIADCGVNVNQQLASAQPTPNNASSTSTAASSGQAQYANDTHFYSNVGGTIVLLKPEKDKMKLTSSKNVVAIPGAAISTAKKKLRMNEPLIGLTAQHYVTNALTSGWIGVEGPHIKKFENALARICGVEAACAVQSGTAALYGAMKALGVSESLHHVLVPTYTCAACADAIVHAGGVPIAVDCELNSYGMSFESVQAVIEKNQNVVGVVIAPSYGVPAKDHVKIYQLCQEHGIWLCEDNCESYGAKMDPRLDDAGEPDSFAKIHAGDWTNAGETTVLQSVGSMSTMSVVSVRSEKMVGVGEGGAILSRDAALVSKARWWCSRAPVRGCGLWRVYEHEEVGQNFRLPELLGELLLS